MLNVREPEILLYAYWPDKDVFDFECEKFDCHVLFLIEKGSFEYRFNSESAFRVASEGTGVFCPGGTAFHRRMLQTLNLHVIYYLGQPISKTQFPFSVRALDSLKRMHEFGFLPTIEKSPLAQHYCRDVLYELYQHSELPQDIDALVHYIGENFRREITNETLCRLLCCCEATLIARFRRAVGFTPQQYITQCRLQCARQELLNTDFSLQQIADRCGYDDPLYFSRLFTRHFGVAPSQYRKQFRL